MYVCMYMKNVVINGQHLLLVCDGFRSKMTQKFIMLKIKTGTKETENVYYLTMYYENSHRNLPCLINS